MYFDALHMTIWRKAKSETRVIESPQLVWRINQGTFVYLPELNDDFLNPRLRRGRGPMDRILVPIRQSGIARTALKSINGSAVYNISSIDELIDFRESMMSIETGWSYARTVRTMLRLYNWRIRQVSESEDLRVRF
jgi:hypothetical protein